MNLRQRIDRIPRGYALAWLCAATAPVLVWMLPPASLLRVLAAMSMLLALPGFSLLAPLYPRQSDMDIPERIALSIAYSLVLDILIGLGLHFTPLGVRIIPLLSITTVVSLLTLTIAIVIRARETDEHAEAVDAAADTSSGLQVVTPSRNWLSPLIAAAVMLLLGGTIASAITRDSNQTFTTFYLLGPDGTIGGLVTRAARNGPYTVQAAVTNDETAPLQYRIIARSARGLVWDGRPFTLAPGETHTEVVSFTLGGGGTEELITYELLTGEPESTYRELTTRVTLSAAVSVTPRAVRTPTAAPSTGTPSTAR